MKSASSGMRLARVFAIVTIAGVGAAAFVLSFAALRGLAVLTHIPARWAWLFPVIVDGTIIQATVSALALAASAERRYFTRVLIAGASVSIVGNSVHAIAAGHSLPWWASAIVAAIAPVSLLIDTHGLAILLRTASAEPAPATESESVPVSVETEPVAGEPFRAPDPVTAVASSAPLEAVRSQRPAQQLLPVAVPVGGA
jgi:hypothetical protein